MNIKKKKILLAVLTSILIYIVSPINGLQTRVLANDNESSTIGGIVVGDLDEDEIRKVVEKEIFNWQSKSIVITGSGNSIQIDPTKLQYNIDESIKQYTEQSSKSWLAFWQKKPVVHIPLVVLPNEEIKKQIGAQPFWEVDATYSNVMTNAAYLRNHEIEAVVSKFSSIDNERIAVSIKEVPATVSGIHAIVDQLNKVMIQSGEEFSLLTHLEPIIGSASSETINFTASLLYESALKLTAQITERHHHQVLPEYLNPGLDAYIQLSQQKDLRFVNILKQPVQLKLTREGLTLKAEFYAATVDENATVRVNRDGEVLPRIITRYSSELPIGKNRLIQEGAPGLRVTVYRTNNVTGEEQLVSRDYYPPTNRIILESSRQPDAATGGVDGSGNSSTNDGTPADSNTNGKDGSPNNSGGTTNGEASGSGSSSSTPRYDKGGKLIH